MATQRQRHADHRALHGDAPRPAGDVHRVGETVQPIGGQHDVGGLGGRRRAARAHRDTDRGRGQRGGVVDSVADHDGHRAFAFGAHRGDLVGRALLGVDLVEPEHGGDLAGRLGAVAGQHDQPVQPGGAQPPHGAGCVAAQRVSQQHRADRLAVDAHPRDRGRVQAGPVHRRAGPARVDGVGGQFADLNPAIVDRGGDAPARFFDHVGRQRQRQPAGEGFGDDGLGEHVRRQLVDRRRQPQYLGGVTSGRGQHFDHDRAPHGEGAGLVHHQSRCVPEVFQRAAAADHHALA